MRLLASSWHAVATVVASHRDVLDARPAEGDVPPALVERGWAPYLLALEDAEVAGLEVDGHDATWPPGAPATLLELAASVRRVCSVRGAEENAPSSPGSKRFENPRKQAQVEAFARVIIPLTQAAERVVDVGSGHGHLTRELAARLGMPVLGLERDAALTARARALAGSGSASFAVSDVLAGGLALSGGDCVVGLHACGELGDVMVESAARVGASIALVGCCLQKRRAVSRAPFAGRIDEGAQHEPSVDPRLVLPRSMLGLSNLTARADGVEATRDENLRARERRVALHRLLAGAGLELTLGAEIEGLNRRAAHGELDVLVARAFALRGLTVPTPAEIRAAERWASMQHARMRRLALPRSLLARVLEVFVLLDRARHLESHGFDVTVGVLFPATVSARNLALVGSARR